MKPPDPSGLPEMDATVLDQRLSSLAQALGAARIGLARRCPASVAGPFHVLATVDRTGERLAEDALPWLAYHWVLREGRLLEADSESSQWRRGLTSRGLTQLLGFALPEDRVVSVAVVAAYDRVVPVGSTRLAVARAGLGALARALAPASWLPLATVPDPAIGSPESLRPARLLSDVVPMPEAVELVERVMLERALRVSEGNRSDAARLLCLTRQGLTKKLRKYGLL